MKKLNGEILYREYPPEEPKLCNSCLVVKTNADFHFYTRNGRKYPRSTCKTCGGKQSNEVYRRQYRENRWMRLAANLRRVNGGKRIPWKTLRDEIGEPDKCYICGYGFEGHEVHQRSRGHGKPYDLELDHVLPTIRGGKTEPGNLKWVHRRCNQLKGEMTPEELLTFVIRVAGNLASRKEN